jgi:hypothetical protein
MEEGNLVYSLSSICRRACIPVMVPRIKFKGESIEYNDAFIQQYITRVVCHELDWMRLMPRLIRLRHLVIRYKKYITPLIQDWHLPDQITHLVLTHHFNQSLVAGVLPPNLHSLVLGPEFNQPIVANVLPTELHTLVLGQSFNQPIAAGVLPTKLRILVFGNGFHQPIDQNVLPRSLQQLTLSYRYNHPFTDDMLETDLCFTKEPRYLFLTGARNI